MNQNTKNYSDSYLYGMAKQEKSIIKFIMEAEAINKTSPAFQNIVYEVKRRQIYNDILTVLNSNKIVLLRHSVGLPRAFKVMCAKDIINGTDELKVFIDVSGIIVDQDGEYFINTNKVDILISYLINAMFNLIYYVEPTAFLNNSKYVEKATICFAKMFTYVIDYMRVANVDNVQSKVLYLSSLYFNKGVMLNNRPGVENLARKISRLTDKEATLLELYIKEESVFYDIKSFVNMLATVLKANNLNFDTFIEKWIFLIGAGTHYGTELLPAFSAILTNAYVGAYLNNQKAVENICKHDLVEYTKKVFEIGSGMLR